VSKAKLAMIAAVPTASADDADALASDRPPPPVHLRPATKAWWRGIVSDHRLEPHKRRVLEAACEAWDMMQTAREALAKHGLTFKDDRDMVRARPEAAIMRDSRAGFLRCMRELGLLKIEPPEIDHNAGAIGITWRQLERLRQQRGEEE
jgi:P27 family predicted phage terminase small subunit